MKTHILSFLLITLSLTAFAQNWKPYHIDDSVQVSLPPDFKKTDTLGQVNITAKTGFGYIQITKLSDSPTRTPDIEKVKHLDKYYDNFVKEIRASSKKGIISNEKDTIIGKLHVKDFTMSVDSGSGKQLREFRVIHENGSTYMFQYLYEDVSKEYALPEATQFFNSISIPVTDVQSQFTSPENTTGKTPGGNKSLYKKIGVAILLLIIILYFVKRSRKAD